MRINEQLSRPKDQADNMKKLADLKGDKKRYEEYLKKLSQSVSGSLVQKEVTPLGKATTIAITSGKGGVGKTTISANLALSLAQSGHRVILLDADLGMANLDLVLGISPQKNLYHLITGTADLNQVITPGPLGISVIAGGSGLSELAGMNQSTRNRLFEQLSNISELGDILIIDTGAGIGPNVMEFLRAADQVILLMNPEPPAIADAYGVLKSSVFSNIKSNFIPVANRVINHESGRELLRRFRGAALRFLNLELHPGSCIVEDELIRESILSKKPLLLAYPRALSVKDIRYLGQLLVPSDEKKEELPIHQQGINSFINRIAQAFGGSSWA